MSRMTKQSAPSNPQTPAIQWPQLTLPPSNSSVKGLTDEQHQAMQQWYLGVQNVINNHNASVLQKVTEIINQVQELQKQSATDAQTVDS